MRKGLSVVCFAFVVAIVSGGFGASNRSELNFNRDWKFTKGDPGGAQGTSFSDASWTGVGLPHSASTPYWMEQKMYLGWAWYRKHFTVDPQWNGRRVFIEFEAVFQHSWVYVNGTLVGEHKGGYTGFVYDITQQINWSGDNVIAVRLNNRWDARIAPRAGDHNFHAGIYRDVRLVATDPLHVPWYGTWVTTPQASAARTTVNIKTEVKNDASAAKTCTVKSTILDSIGQLVTSVSSTVNLAAGQLDTVSQDTAFASPKLWSPSSPYLYSMRTEIYDNGVLVDDYTTQFGVRWFSMTAANGFSLNGQHLFLRGFNVHQDHAGWADAVTNYAYYRDIKMLKDCGTVCVRASHYPHDASWYGACDKVGILVWAELHFWGRGGFSGGDEDTTWFAQAYPTVDADRAEFEANLIANLKDMIREARNHPSIFCYSLGNETDMSENGNITLWQNTRAFWKRLDSVSHHEDATRPTTCGWVYFTYTNITDQERQTFVDFVGMNGGNPGSQQAFPVLTSEYGSCVVMSRPGSYTGCGEPGDEAWRMGKLRWCAFHHGTHCEGNGGNWGHMGVIDYNRLPLEQYYWYRNQWLGIAPPAWPSAGTASKLVLTADKTTILNDGTDDCQLVITVQNASGQRINNSVNGTLQITGPGVLPTGTSWNFDTPDGQQAIEMRSYGTGAVTATASSGSLQSGTIQITVQGPTVSNAGREGPAYIRNNAVMSDFCLGTKTGGRDAAAIRYTLGSPVSCRLTVYTIDGQVINIVDLGRQSPGPHQLAFEPAGNGRTASASGMYLVTLRAGNAAKTRLLQFVR